MSTGQEYPPQSAVVTIVADKISDSHLLHHRYDSVITLSHVFDQGRQEIASQLCQSHKYFLD